VASRSGDGSFSMALGGRRDMSNVEGKRTPGELGDRRYTILHFSTPHIYWVYLVSLMVHRWTSLK